MKPAVQTLNLEGLLVLARQNNPTLQQARQQTIGEAGKAKEAGLWYNPTFSYRRSIIGLRGECDARRHTAGEFQGLNIQQRIVTAHKLGLSRDKYLAREEAAKAEEDVQALRVENDVRIRYYETLAGLELVNITGEMLKTAQDHWLTTKEQFNEGLANQVEHHLANAELERARLRYELARNDYRLHLGRLAAVVGADLSAAQMTGSLGAMPGSIQVIDYDQALNQVLYQFFYILRICKLPFVLSLNAANQAGSPKHITLIRLNKHHALGGKRSHDMSTCPSIKEQTVPM